MQKYDKIYVPVLSPDTKLTLCSVESHIVQQIDVDLYNQVMEQEAEDVKILEAFINKK